MNPMVAEVTGWRKSSRSHQDTDCVEVGRTPEGGAAVRDSKDRGAGYFTVSPEAWNRFVATLKADGLG